MKSAVVINVAPSAAALSRATTTQSLLIDHMGPQLDSIRLAVPHLLQFACMGAISEKPDLLVVVGGPKAARSAGQVAHRHAIPVLFLPGMRFPAWARQLWGTLTLEEMIAALASGSVRPTTLGAGSAAGHIFFGQASCGLLPHLGQLGEDLTDVETFTAGLKVLTRTTAVAGSALRSKVRFHCRGGQLRASASALTIKALGGEGRRSSDGSVTPLGAFACTAWNYRTLTHPRAIAQALAGSEWEKLGEAHRFTCSRLTLDAGAGRWLLLDGEPIRLRGPVEFRFLPNAVRTFAYDPRNSWLGDGADREYSQSLFAQQLRAGRHNRWNLGRPSHVRNSANESRANGRNARSK